MSTVGENIDEVERLTAEQVGTKYAVALSCGTAAMHLAVKLAGVKPGDWVFCSDLTFNATVNPVVYEGGVPVFIDSETDTWNMDPEALEKQLYTDAMEYAPRNRPAIFEGLSEMLSVMSKGAYPADADSSFYVATVEDNEQGAGVIMYPGFLDMASEKLGGDLYILPSSVHEVLILQDTKDFNTAEFNEMIATINAAEVWTDVLITINEEDYASAKKI